MLDRLHDYFTGFRITSIAHTDRLKLADQTIESLTEQVMHQLSLPEVAERSATITQIFVASIPQIQSLTSCKLVFDSLDRARTLCGQAEKETIILYLLQALHMIKIDLNLKAIEENI